MPPYIPLPYASDQPAYSNRDYTLKQMQLLEQQAAREAAYERERGTMMAGRWAGLGGLATETLGSLVQARDLRQAKALEQARYDTQQARIASQDARLAEEDRVAAAKLTYEQQQRRANQIKELAGVGGTLTDQQAAEMEAANPGSTEQFRIAPQSMTTLSSLARPEDPGRAFRSLDFSGGVPEKRTLFSSSPNFTGRFGEELVEGTTMTPEVSGVRMRMTGPQGKELSKEIVRDSALQSLIDSGKFTPQQAAILRASPDLPPQAWAELFPAPRTERAPQTLPTTFEGLATQLTMRAMAESDPAKRAEFLRQAEVAKKSDIAQRNASRATSSTEFETVLDPTGNPVSFPKGSKLPPGFRPYSASNAAPIPFTDAEKEQTKKEIVSLATNLKNNAKLGSIYGPYDSRTFDLVPTTIGIVADIEQLQSLLTLANLGKMKGVLSDTDIRILTTAATTIGNRGMGVARAKLELQRIIDKFNSSKMPSAMSNQPLPGAEQ